ncbi:small ribosomal subunit protein mS27 isoform X2 [Periplaneta americana]|uniref:small ribosomal subunit protein mS27 isoform X2 n=1 Tax=Periplaneta americana TaxID=6978 RepID=UPI0037E7A006
MDIVFTEKRFFLSDEYRCREEWERRRQAPIFQNMKLDELYQDLDNKYQNTGKVSAIDIDLFANAVQDEENLDELDDLLHKLRLSASTTDMLPSTSHSVVRTYLALGRHDELLRILDDRLNYGVFPDDYCSGLLMDTFLKQHNYTGAAKVGVLHMLQEDWSHCITSHLALYSCHMYLRNPESTPWEDPSKTEEVEDDGEEIKVRVKYLRNPYFDDHFDLKEPKLLVGKTLASLGTVFPDSIGRTYELVGWGLYRKWDKAKAVLQGQGPAIFRDGLEMFKASLEECEIREELLPLLTQLESAGQVIGDDLHEAVVSKVRSEVSKQESEAIAAQCKLYKEWETLREDLLQQQLKELDKQQRLSNVRAEKERISKDEEVLFFFDNEEKWELAIEKKRKFYRRRYFGKRKTFKSKDENYIPPEV